MNTNLRDIRQSIVTDAPVPLSEAEQHHSEKKLRLERFARLSQFSAIGLVVVLLVAVVAIQISEQDQIRANVTVFGIDVGGMTRDDALAAVQHARDVRMAQELELVDNGQQWDKSAATLGLHMDVEAAVDKAFDSGRSGFGLSRLAAAWHLRPDNLTVGADQIVVDEDALAAQLQPIADEIHQPRIVPALNVTEDGTAVYTNAQVGRDLDREASIERISDALASGATTVNLAVIEDAPAATDEDFAAARDTMQQILDAPIVIKAGEQTWEFTPPEVLPAISVKAPIDGSPAEIIVDSQWVESIIQGIAFQVDRGPRSPRVWWNGDGELVVTEQPKDGIEIDQGQAVALFTDVLTGENSANEITLPATTIPAPAPPSDLASLGLSSVIAESTTPYGYSIPERKHNIELAASLLNGTLVMPGQTFSFNSEIGSTSLEAGFQIGYGIANVNGALRTVPSEAGGICQVSTTVFQPVFSTGYEIVERYTHSYWIDHYKYHGMVGMDATVDEASGLDFRWKNDSNYPVLLQVIADGQNFTVKLIGQQPDWEVELKEPVVTNIDWADTETIHYQPDTSLPVGSTMAIEHAENGFDVRTVRIVKEPDGTERVWDVTTTYGKSRNVVLVGSEDGELPPGFPPS